MSLIYCLCRKLGFSKNVKDTVTGSLQKGSTEGSPVTQLSVTKTLRVSGSLLASLLKYVVPKGLRLTPLRLNGRDKESFKSGPDLRLNGVQGQRKAHPALELTLLRQTSVPVDDPSLK